MNEIIVPINGVDTPIQSEHSFVIIGANGSGKSHLGAWIEKRSMSTTLRISAQRALSIKDNIAIKSEETSFYKIMYGTENLNDYTKSKVQKWGNNEYTTKLVDDYDSVISGIFARNNKDNEDFVDECKKRESEKLPHPQVPITIITAICKIWDEIYPHRQLILKDATVKAKSNSNIYKGKDMSDGERVALYLIGQCLLSPYNHTIIIDEPEIHLHKAIMHKLWDKIEEYCPDKTFVYITHDLDFAASRKDAKKIWVKSYDMENNREKWDIQILEDHDIIPDDLLIEILGNRKDVLLVEGEKGSYDYQLYTHIYDNCYIVPCHNCHKVIELTKAFNEPKTKELHNITVQGIIDRDYLSETEIGAYKEKGIYPLEVAEVENLYLLTDIQRIVAEHMALDNIPEVLKNVKNYLFNEFVKEKDAQITAICEREIQYKLSRFQKEGNDYDSLKFQFDSLVKSIDVEGIYKTVEDKVKNIITDKNFDELLKIYNRKSLHQRISAYFKLSKNEYPQLVLRLLKTEKKESIVNVLRRHMPQI